MKEYYQDLTSKGKSDDTRNGVAVFRIGEGDAQKFPELLQVHEVWVYPSGNIQTIHIDTVTNYNQGRNLYENNVETQNRIYD